jgi:hypothetical protein
LGAGGKDTVTERLQSQVWFQRAEVAVIRGSIAHCLRIGQVGPCYSESPPASEKVFLLSFLDSKMAAK